MPHARKCEHIKVYPPRTTVAVQRRPLRETAPTVPYKHAHFAIVRFMDSQSEKIGFVLMNTGTPDSPDPRDIKPYLIEFLSDPNLIHMPRALWLPILHLFIANKRPEKTAPRYEKIWTPEGSPFILDSRLQAQGINQRFQEAGINAIAKLGMRYGNPSLDTALNGLEAAGCRKIIAFPLFPQTAFCTVGSCKGKIKQVMRHHKNLQLAGVIEGYNHNPLYHEALAASIREAWEYQPGSKLMFSFHSIPLSDVKAGDTYVEQIKSDLQKVTELLGIPKNDWSMAFHSRFEDPHAWVTPHPRAKLSEWAEEGVTRVGILTPGFAADCLESLYDIKDVTCEYFRSLCKQHGREADITYIPALNHREDHLDLLFEVAKQALEKL